MFRNGLLATTALVIVGSLSFLAAQPAAGARAATAGHTRDRNNEFLCTYGGFLVHYRYSVSSSSFSSAWTHVAVPVTGRGQRVDTIIVKEAGSSFPSHSQFSAGIYASDRSGFPGKLISGGKGTAPTKCRTVAISIPPTILESGKTYWVEETVPFPGFGSSTTAIWAINPKTKLRAYEQSHYASSASGYHRHHTSPWMEQSAGPYLKLR